MTRPPLELGLPFAPRAYRDIDEWRASEAVLGADVRHITEYALAERLAPAGCLSGYCWICGRRTDFVFQHVPGGPMPDWREQLTCTGCSLITRARLGLLLALAPLEALGRGAVPYITEQVTPLFRWLRDRFPATIGSEFVRDRGVAERLGLYLAQLARGHAEGLRHEDVTALGLADGSVDAVLSFEVLEHVPRYRAALAEFRRVIRPGGRLVLSVPFISTNANTVVRAELQEDGSVRHLLPPEYHGDPTAEDGCLAFYNFGWDLLDELRAAGFAEAGLVDAWSPASALLGPLGVIVATRR
jgi:hypothetical protein